MAETKGARNSYYRIVINVYFFKLKSIYHSLNHREIELEALRGIRCRTRCLLVQAILQSLEDDLLDLTNSQAMRVCKLLNQKRYLRVFWAVHRPVVQFVEVGMGGHARADRMLSGTTLGSHTLTQV